MSDSSPPPTTKPVVQQNKPENSKANPEHTAYSDIQIGVGTILIFTMGLILGHPGPVGDALSKGSPAIEALATVAIFFLGITQWRTMRAQNDGAKKALAQQTEASERDQRGYVMYKESKFRPNGSLVMIWSNFGKTPVKDVEAFIYATVAPGGATGQLSTVTSAAAHARICLAPGAEYWIDCQLQTFDRSIGAAGIAWTNVEYLHGRVEYTDAFNQRRSTQFKYWIRADGPQNCDDGNDWT